MKYYVYSHRRLDKNEIFYIGVGTKPDAERIRKHNGNTTRGIYYRAFETTKGRNPHWKNIVAKTDYEIAIIAESDIQQEVLDEEIKLIALHKDTLCNLTAGGHGATSYIHTQEDRDRISNTMSGRKLTKEHTINANQRKYKPIEMYEFGIYQETFDSLENAALYIGDISYYKNISACALGNRASAYGYTWKYESKESIDKEL